MAVWSVKEADADQFRIALAGIALAKGAGQSGYADGEFLRVEQNKDSFGVYEGSDGAITRYKTNSRLVDITITLVQTSASNPVIAGLIAADEAGVNGSGIGSFLVQDLQGTTLVLCTRAWARKRAPVVLDRAPQERAWLLQGVFDVFLVGGN